jgi:hypothetical protein
VPVGVPEELELLELLDDELELLLDDELELEELDELLDDELEELELLELEELLEDELLELDGLVRPIIPTPALRPTASNFAPSSRRRILRVWGPAARLVNVATAMLLQPLVCTLFWVVQAPESSL